MQMGHNPEYVDGSQSRIIWTMSLMQCKMITSQNNSGLSQACNLLWIVSPLQILACVTPFKAPWPSFSSFYLYLVGSAV